MCPDGAVELSNCSVFEMTGLVYEDLDSAEPRYFYSFLKSNYGWYLAFVDSDEW
jgi:hypothetical protein